MSPVAPIYLDHHATTPVDPRVLEAMLPWFGERFGNAASVNHMYGTEAAEAVETAREQVARLLGTSARSLIFTSGATEANNLALKGVMAAAPSGSHMVTTAAEHRSVLDVARRLKRSGCEVTILPVDEFARVTAEQVAAALRPETVLVSVILASNEVGTLNPIEEIAHVCSRRGVLLHTDAVQAAGKRPLDLDALPIDLASFSAHKLYGPKGVGALFVRRGGRRIAIEPLFDGGGHEAHLRSGTLPVPLVVGFGRACELAGELMSDEAARLHSLRERLWLGLSQRLDGIVLNGHPVDRLPGNLNVSFEGVGGEALMSRLTEIAVSSGSACTSADPEPSHVLKAMGRSDALTRASLRFGLGRDTTAEQIDRAVEHVVTAVTWLRCTTPRPFPSGSGPR